MKYKRGETYYECEESKFRQEVTVKHVIKFALPGDWICYPLDDKGARIPLPFIAQAKEFYTKFKKV